MLIHLLPLLISLLGWVFGTDEAELVFAGDAMMHQAQIDAAKREGGDYNFDECFAEVTPWVLTADYAVVNLETPTSAEQHYSGYPCFNAPPVYIDALADAGFDLFLTANNHTLDRHGRGLRATVAELDKRQLDHIGTYTDGNARRNALPFVREINEIKVGFLNYTYGTNGIKPDGDVAVDYIDRDLIRADIADLRKAGAEVICVCVHWGVEYSLTPHPTQKLLADFLVKEGVDLIIGGHPHVVQPWEMRHNDATGKDVLVVYSLGNFISNMKTRDTRGGGLIRVKLQRDSNRTVRIANIETRLVYTIPGEDGHNFRLVWADSCDIPAHRARAVEFVKSARRVFK